MKPLLCNRLRNRGYFSRPPQAFCIEKYNISRSGYHSKFHQILCLPRKVTLQLHRIVRLPRKVTVMTDPRHIWNVIYNARNNRWRPPAPPNTAPSAKWFSKFSATVSQNRCNVNYNPRPIRDHSENDPRMKPSLRNPPRNWGYFSYSAFHEKWHFNFTKYSHDQSATHLKRFFCTLYNTRNNRWHPPTSRNTAPFTPKFQKHFFPNTDETSVTRRDGSETIPRMNRAWNCHSATRLATKSGYFSRPPQAFFIEKYNISSSGYHSKFHQILCLPRKVTLQLHRILRLPRKVTVITDRRHIWNVIYNARNSRWRPPAPPNTAPSAKWFSKFSETVPQTRWNVNYNARPIRDHSENDPRMKPSLRNPPRNWGYFSYCALNEKWHFHFTKYCACHAKWLSWSIRDTPETFFYNTRDNRWHPPTSPNTAPFTPKFQKHFFSNTDETSVTMRDGSETIPRMNRAWNCHSATRLATKSGYFSRPPHAFCKVSRSGYHSKFHQILHVPRKVTLQLHLHQTLRLPHKMTLMINPRHTWNAIYNARNNRWHPPTPPNTAPATPNDSPKFQKNFPPQLKRQFPFREQSLRKLAKIGKVWEIFSKNCKQM